MSDVADFYNNTKLYKYLLQELKIYPELVTTVKNRTVTGSVKANHLDQSSGVRKWNGHDEDAFDACEYATSVNTYNKQMSIGDGTIDFLDKSASQIGQDLELDIKQTGSSGRNVFHNAVQNKQNGLKMVKLIDEKDGDLKFQIKFVQVEIVVRLCSVNRNCAVLVPCLFHEWYCDCSVIVP